MDAASTTPGAPGISSILPVALLVYTLIALVLAIRQSGYINEDFIGYATIAHRVLAHPWSSISGFWSPLFSWCMVPLIALGVEDLLAGRIVLLLAGAAYLAAFYKIARRFSPRDPELQFPCLVGAMTCAVIQAVIGASYLLDPDLLAAALLFIYFALILDPALQGGLPRAGAGARRGMWAFLAGLAAGLAYLAKAFMLPFVLIHLPVTLWLAHRAGRHEAGVPAGSRRWLLAGVLCLAGLAVISAPWIGVLNTKYHHFTFSTAGAANHANVSPDNDGQDLLFHPGLVPDFLADPHYGPDWSPFQDGQHFLHQLKLIGRNSGIASVHLISWLLLALLAAAWWATRRGWSKKVPSGTASGACLHAQSAVSAESQPAPDTADCAIGIAPLAVPLVEADIHRAAGALSSDQKLGIQWCLLTVLIYVGGYSLVIVEGRYIVPVAAPLLCLAAMLFLTALPHATAASPGSPWFARLLPPTGVWAALLLVAPFMVKDVMRMGNIALSHRQSTKLSTARLIAQKLDGADIGSALTASNQGHEGVYVAYARNRLANYLGTPLSTYPDAVAAELHAAGARCFLRWLDTAALQPAPLPPGPPWRLKLVIADPALGATRIEVYMLP